LRIGIFRRVNIFPDERKNQSRGSPDRGMVTDWLPARHGFCLQLSSGP
jgi:hypothetical protein